MTCISLGGDKWRLEFSEPESLFFITVLSQLEDHYRQEVQSLPTAQRDYWQGTPEEGMEIMAEMRQELRAERLVLAEAWRRAYEVTTRRNPWRLELSQSQKDELLAMLNDRRLLLALQYGLEDGEVEMELREIPEESRRNALFEINLLGQLIFLLIGPQIYKHDTD